MKKLSECKSCQKRLGFILLGLSGVALFYLGRDLVKIVKNKKK